ncbi:hypothetical protein [Aquimarina pacifica]|uniref:hypothetical protein n=1 Tax=Aquimarina pacifica TaxID=1296415 RepID=UPI00046EA2CD|nr:hypothetical protein [Aquimarina pacifica]
MTKEYYLLIGVVIGGLISLLTNLINQRYINKRETNKLALEMAKEEYQAIINLYSNIPGTIIRPLETYITYYLKYVKIVSRKSFKIQDLDKIRIYREELFEYYDQEYKNKVQ